MKATTPSLRILLLCKSIDKVLLFLLKIISAKIYIEFQEILLFPKSMKFIYGHYLTRSSKNYNF